MFGQELQVGGLQRELLEVWKQKTRLEKENQEKNEKIANLRSLLAATTVAKGKKALSVFLKLYEDQS